MSDSYGSHAPSEMLDWRRGVRRDEQRALPAFITFRASPVGPQPPQIRTDFRNEEPVGLNPAPPALAILVCNILFWYIPFAADMDHREVSKSSSPRFSIDGRRVKPCYSDLRWLLIPRSVSRDCCCASMTRHWRIADRGS